MNYVMVILSGPGSWITRKSELLLLLKNHVNFADLWHLDIEESRSTGCCHGVKYNVIKVKIIYDYSKKVNVPRSAESWIAYKQVSDEMLKITYDDKPSPYTAISKYWKFTGQDFSGFGAYNLDKPQVLGRALRNLKQEQPG